MQGPVLSDPVLFRGARPGEFGAPSPAGPVARRLHELAASLNLTLLPLIYTAECAGGLSEETLTIQPDTAEGPVFVYDIQAPSSLGTLSANTWELGLASGSRTLIEGRVRGRRILQDMDENGLNAPVVINRSDTLRVTLSMPTPGLTVAGQGIFVQAFVVRSVEGARVGALADRLARLVRAEGEFYCAGVVATAQDSVSLSYGGIMQAFSIVVDPAGAGAAASAVKVTLGNHEITPTQLSGNVFPSPGPGAVALRNCRNAFAAGARLTLYPSYLAANPQPVSVSLVGRRRVG
jgi:hypothetical protein